eukprot:CAMPEP_0170567342 /NCGR_PEP_ID=MMETSP0211-20121228/80417_1 /TAXON_ID=311385 /ORGANISM="Pseudokeronopsis sp., Strain OXSARD2" /LENGTH=104 /DNA_ID=CAMNT_0010888763 /DNA_START=127 /DNA_END=441 /DNA_ORIENTATION=+
MHHAIQVSNSILISTWGDDSIYVFNLRNDWELIKIIKLECTSWALLAWDEENALIGTSNGKLMKISLKALTCSLITQTKLQWIYGMTRCLEGGHSIGVAGKNGV